MLERLTTRQLQYLTQQLDLTRRQYRLLQSLKPRQKRTERGAYVHPALAEDEAALEKRLLKSYRQLGTDWLKSLSGASDDISSGRLLQAKKPTPSKAEELDALNYFEVPEDEADKPVDKSRLAALLALLLLWKNRHLAISDGTVRDLFERGRAKALADAKRPNAPVAASTTGMEHEILNKYEADIAHLEQGLGNGTRRSYGIRFIIDMAPTVGAAAALIRKLLDAEAYRVSMFAESLVWTAYQQGRRAGAIDTSTDILKTDFGHPFAVKIEDLTDDEKEQLPRYRWDGPQDNRNCPRCAAQFEQPDVYALSPNDLPLPEEICEAGRSCRHDWLLVS